MEALNLVCFECKHFEEFSPGCRAFKEIPKEITSGKNKHVKPLKNQENDIVFEKL